jgi:hypothetical protein
MTDKLKTKYRVLRDFTDREGKEHKSGDIVEFVIAEARGYVNSDKLTTDLGEAKRAEMKEV